MGAELPLKVTPPALRTIRGTLIWPGVEAKVFPPVLPSTTKTPLPLTWKFALNVCRMVPLFSLNTRARLSMTLLPTFPASHTVNEPLEMIIVD